MSIQKTLGYLFAGAFSLLTLVVYGQADSTNSRADSTAKQQPTHRQLTIGFDVSAPIKNALQSSRTGYELCADYYLRNELYLALEGGWGSSNVAYPDLKYTANSYFARVGFHRFLFPRETPNDWGGMLLGLRLGYAGVNRGAATFTIIDSVWGNATSAQPSKTFGAYWIELNGGVRVELYKGIMAGWTLRGKFLMNGKSFADLAPLYVAGYGRGDKNAVFDINFYISYALRQRR
jgi:hypothetical protein